MGVGNWALGAFCCLIARPPAKGSAAHPQRRLVVVFQPHRYSRTRDLFDDFVAVLAQVDVLLLGEVYAAGEAPIEGADARALARAIRARGAVEPVLLPGGIAEAPNLLERIVTDGDLILTLGAGDVGNLPALLVQRYGAAK